MRARGEVPERAPTDAELIELSERAELRRQLADLSQRFERLNAAHRRLEGEHGQLLDRLIQADEHIHRLEQQLDGAAWQRYDRERLSAHEHDLADWSGEGELGDDTGPELERPTLN